MSNYQFTVLVSIETASPDPLLIASRIMQQLPDNHKEVYHAEMSSTIMEER